MEIPVFAWLGLLALVVGVGWAWGPVALIVTGLCLMALDLVITTFDG